MKPATTSLAKAHKLFQGNQLAAALKEVRAFLEISPDAFEALQLCGAICSDLGRHDEALEYLRRAADHFPNSAQAHHNLGNALMSAGEIPDASRSFAVALKLEPRTPLLLCASANALTELKRYDEALPQFKRAISLDGRFADAFYGLGRTLMIMKDFPAAKSAFLRAFELDPRDRKAALNAFHCGLEMADWRDFDKWAPLSRAAALEGTCETPFRALLLFDEPKTQARAAAGALALRPPSKPLAPRSPRTGGRIRIGYFSADFRSHPTSRLLVGVIENHNRANFEVIGISIGENAPAGGIGERIRHAFDTFIDMSDATSAAIRRKASELEIDIAIDLMGHTEHARPELFRPRLAPLQMNFLGYPGTSGNPDMDYIIVDPFIAETIAQQSTTERPIILPGCYQPNDARRPAPLAPRPRSEYGLPDGFVFCCFNEPRKITPATFDSWMRILKATPSSVLWLYAPGDGASGNLRSEASRRSVDPSRIITCGRVGHEEHLARYRHADLFLDTFPYTAHTTASDALWAGCPVLTRAGTSFVSRVAGSILASYGLPELVTASPAEFETVACRLASSPDELGAIRNRIPLCDVRSTLFDTKRYTEGFDRSLEAIWSRHLARKNPGRIVV